MCRAIASAIWPPANMLSLCFGSSRIRVRTFDARADCDQTFLILFCDEMDLIMLAATIKNLLRDVLDVFRRAEQALASLGAERRCALRLDRLGDRLTTMGGKINQLRAHIADEVGEAIDGDHALRSALKGLKEDIREIRCQLAGMQTPQLSARLQRAFARLGKIAEETYASADKLQWEIDEHDQKFV
jgi:hypothetical protein